MQQNSAITQMTNKFSGFCTLILACPLLLKASAEIKLLKDELVSLTGKQLIRRFRLIKAVVWSAMKLPAVPVGTMNI